MTEKKKKDTKKETKAVEVSEKIRKQVIKESKEKLKKEAEKIALQLKTEMELETQIELTDIQEEAALLISCGFSYEETATKTGVALREIKGWMKLPHFVRRMNELTVKEGTSEKNERIRKQKRIVDELYDVFLDRKDELKKVGIKDLMEIMLKQGDRLDKLVDKNEEKTQNNSFTMLILNHGKTTSGRDYKDIEEFFNDEEYSYPTLNSDDIIDVSAEEVKDDN
jgi:hypothetical protein